MEWNPKEIIECFSLNSENSAKQGCNYSILLLNQPIQKEQNFISLWNNASVRAIADGGGNQWDVLRKKYPGTIKQPHIVSGDFDSLSSDVLEFFKAKEDIQVILTEDQDETDFTKALRILANRITQRHPEISKIIAFCETSGRFDQIMGNVETLFHAQNFVPQKQIFLTSSSSITWLLPAGFNKIFISKENPENNFKIPYCSLIPIGSPCKVTTSGLKWNLQNDTLAFGRSVSTSNEVEKHASNVTIENSEPLLWSMEFEFNNDL